MKIIFSRKGFDSVAGGFPSPVYEDGSLVSLPIPEPNPKPDDLRYADVDIGGTSLGQVVEQLSEGRVRAIEPVHLDPDLRAGARPRTEGWRPAFGQAGSAQGHLARQKVGAGDLFLFFGSFARAVNARGRHEYRDKKARFHALFGWLQVDVMLDPELGPASLPAWARDHPHARHTYPGANALYIAKSTLSVPGASVDLPGAGAFAQMHDELILTSASSREGHSPRQSCWSLPRCFLPEAGPSLTYHRAPKRWCPDPSNADRVLLELVHRGQEFVFDAADYPGAVEWAVGLIAKHGYTPPETYGR